MMKKYGHSQGNGHHILFTKKNDKKVTILLVYIEYIIVTCDNDEEIDMMKKMFMIELELKDLRKLRYFLDIELARSRIGLILNKR